MWKWLFLLGGGIWIAFGVWKLSALQADRLSGDWLIFFLILDTSLYILPGIVLLTIGASIGRGKEKAFRREYRSILLQCPECQRDFVPPAIHCPECGAPLGFHQHKDTEKTEKTEP